MEVSVLFGKKKQKAPKCLAAIYMEHMEGIEFLPYNEGIALRIRPGETHIEMECKKENGKEKIFLPFSQIIQVNIIIWEKIITKALNPMAEALVTGIIAGDAMAVAAAVDAKGRTRSERVKKENALEIQYHPKGDSLTIKRLVFWDRADFSAKKDTIQFAEKLSPLANLPGPNFLEPKPKGPTYL